MTETRKDKWYKAMIKRYGSIEAWREQHLEWASKGGKKSTSRPFRADNNLAREAGRKGGLAKRNSKLKGGGDGDGDRGEVKTETTE